MNANQAKMHSRHSCLCVWGNAFESSGLFVHHNYLWNWFESNICSYRLSRCGLKSVLEWQNCSLMDRTYWDVRSKWVNRVSPSLHSTSSSIPLLAFFCYRALIEDHNFYVFHCYRKHLMEIITFFFIHFGLILHIIRLSPWGAKLIY